MKYLHMKDNQIGNASTADVIRVCVDQVPPGPNGGLGTEDVRRRVRVLDALEKANGVLALEDADAKTLQQCVANMKWAKVSPDIPRFVDAVNNMSDTA